MAHELLNVKSQLQSGAQIVGQELDRIDNQVRILTKNPRRSRKASFLQ